MKEIIYISCCIVFGIFNYIGLPLLYPDITNFSRIKNSIISAICFPAGLITLLMSLIFGANKTINELMQNAKLHNTFTYVITFLFYLLVYLKFYAS